MSSSAFNLLDETLKDKIINRMGWKSLTPVQERAIPEIMNGKNAIILAPTAGGKTEACFFPILSLMKKNRLSGLRCIYITPIKALLNNQETRIANLSSFLDFNSFKWHGDVSVNLKNKFLKEPTNILLTTPESLEVILASRKNNRSELFKNLEFIIVDEVHSFVASDRGAQLISIIERLKEYSVLDFQKIGLSATVGNPLEILQWLQGSSNRRQIVIKPENSKKQRKIEIKYCETFIEKINALYRRTYGRKALIFSNNKKNCEDVNHKLKEMKIDSYVHHASIEKERREIVEEYFKEGINKTIVATSTLELGIDIGDLDIVLQLDSPGTVSSFLQRMGRTGRRINTSPWFVFLPEERTFVQSLAILSLAIEQWVEPIKINKKNYSTLAHQIILIVYSEDGVTLSTIFEKIKSVESFKEISYENFRKLVKHFLYNKVLEISGNKLYVGEKLEEDYGSKNYMEIYSTFTTDEVYTVKHSIEKIGEIDYSYAYKLEKGSMFILSGGAWCVEKIDEVLKIIYVKRATKAEGPRWSSQGIKISFEIYQKIAEILTGKIKTDYLGEIEKNILKKLQNEFLNTGFSSEKISVLKNRNKIIIFTFAGIKVNRSLMALLKIEFKELDDKLVFEDKIEINFSSKNIILFLSELKLNYSEILKNSEKKIISEIVGSKNAKFSEYLPLELAQEEACFELFDFINLEKLLRKKIEIKISDLC